MKLLKQILAAMTMILMFLAVPVSAEEAEGTESLAGEAYAVFNENTGVLVFSRTGEGEVIPESDEFLTVYSGIEEKEYVQYTDVPWYSVREQITNVEVQKTIQPISMANWFAYTKIENTLTFENFDVQNVTSLRNLFANCKNLKSIEELNEWNTSEVKDLGGAFYYCQSLISLT